MNKLEYGHWYSCEECMPEDFEELLDVDTASKEVIIHLGGEEFDISFRRKFNYDSNGSWDWYGYQKVIHWMAIPKLESSYETD